MRNLLVVCGALALLSGCRDRGYRCDDCLDPDIDGDGVDDGEQPAACAAVDIDAPRLWPRQGELYYQQIGLGGPSLGEAALIVGPDGTTALVDVGNDSHDDDVRDALDAAIDAINDGWTLRRERDQVDHVLITHYHADHADGIEDLTGDVEILGSLIHRGIVDVHTANQGSLEKVCRSAAGIDRPLCASAAAASCDRDRWSGERFAAIDCPGLPGGLALGAARLEVLAVDGWIGGDSFERDVRPLDRDDSNEENARSLVLYLSFGSFRALLAGDLTGGGSDTAAVEPYLAARLGAIDDIAGVGVDLVHLGHHGRDTSSSSPWIDLLAPNDGLDRNAVIGISTAHLDSPHDVVLDTVLSMDRLGDGRAWTTKISAGGAHHPALSSAGGGDVVVRTYGGGAGYDVQAIDKGGAVLRTVRYGTARACAGL